MNVEEMYELLEIEFPHEFEYFEQLAELIECTEEVSYDAFYILLSQVDYQTLADLLECYFEDLMQGIPDEATDLYTLMTTIHQMLTGLCRAAEDEDMRRSFIDEFYRFRNWYTFDSVVRCEHLKNQHTSIIPLLEAFSLYRMEKLGESKYDYDFTDCIDYQIEEYIMPLSSFPDGVDEDEEDGQFEEGYEEIYDDEYYEE